MIPQAKHTEVGQIDNDIYANAFRGHCLLLALVELVVSRFYVAVVGH